jgi:hypothetical protein
LDCNGPDGHGGADQRSRASAVQQKLLDDVQRLWVKPHVLDTLQLTPLPARANPSLAPWSLGLGGEAVAKAPNLPPPPLPEMRSFEIGVTGSEIQAKIHWSAIMWIIVAPDAQQEPAMKRKATSRRKQSRPVHQPIDLHSDRVYPPVEIADFLGLSLSTLRRLWDRGEGPPRIQLSPRRTGSTGRGILGYLNRQAG